jgi:uncharacterized membrane protein (UPF0136 family)
VTIFFYPFVCLFTWFPDIQGLLAAATSGAVAVAVGFLHHMNSPVGVLVAVAAAFLLLVFFINRDSHYPAL